MTGVSQGSMLEPECFNISISDTHIGNECNFSKSGHDIQFRSAVDKPEERDATKGTLAGFKRELMRPS